MTPPPRFPLVTPEGQARLRWLEEHPHAPRFNHLGVDRLTQAGVLRVQAFEDELNAAGRGWAPGQAPAWLVEFTRRAWHSVPHYRAYGPPPGHFFDIPTTDRASLSRTPWSFVPDDAPLEGLIVYQTSGTTGHPLDILSHPETAAHYLPLLRRALATYGVALEAAAGDAPPVTIALICSQASTYTYAAVSGYLNHAGFVKLNLHPAGWRDPADRARFLDDCRPRVYSGDPVSLAALAALGLSHRPRALVSTAMALLPGLRDRLAETFGCPVIDVYSMNEAGPIAVGYPRGQGHLLLSHRLYVEVLDPHGAACAPGERGEITLSGGFNPYLPLLRYRTGDYASLDLTDRRQPRLLGLEGRAPVIFHDRAGRRLNNIDVTAALKPLALPQFTLHQAADGALILRLPPDRLKDDQPRSALLAVFGAGQAISVLPLEAPASGKVVQYSSEVVQP
jgi:phenylacetate-CoA ligase